MPSSGCLMPSSGYVSERLLRPKCDHVGSSDSFVLSSIQKEPKVRATRKETIPAMAASCALSAPSSFLAHQPLYQNKPNKRLTPCLPSPRAVALRVGAAKLPPGVSDTSGEKNASGYCKRLVQRVSTVSCSFSVVFRLKCPGCSQS